MNTKRGGETLRRNMIKRYGSEAAWKAHMAEIGKIGGKVSHPETRPLTVKFRKLNQLVNKGDGND